MKASQFGPYVYKVEYGDEHGSGAARHWIYEKSVNPRIPISDQKFIHIASFMSWIEAKAYVEAKRAESEEIKAQYELYRDIKEAQEEEETSYRC